MNNAPKVGLLTLVFGMPFLNISLFPTMLTLVMMYPKLENKFFIYVVIVYVSLLAVNITLLFVLFRKRQLLLGFLFLMAVLVTLALPIIGAIGFATH